MRFLSAGPRALMIECDETADVSALAAEVARHRRRGWAPELSDVVPGARTLLLDGVADIAATRREIAAWTPPPVREDADDAVELSCVYDGEDLRDVARAWGVDEQQAIALHAATEFTVAFCGFAPGFAYMVGLGRERTVRRRDSPRTSIPAGSVALAGEYCGIYPRSSPGGWQLIGRTDAPLWSVDSDPPALLTPGRRVRFTPA